MGELIETLDAHGRVSLISCNGSLCSLKWSHFVCLSCKRESNGGLGVGAVATGRSDESDLASCASLEPCNWLKMLMCPVVLWCQGKQCHGKLWLDVVILYSGGHGDAQLSVMTVKINHGPAMLWCLWLPRWAQSLIRRHPNHQPYAPYADRTSAFITSYMSTITITMWHTYSSTKKYFET